MVLCDLRIPDVLPRYSDPCAMNEHEEFVYTPLRTVPDKSDPRSNRYIRLVTLLRGKVNDPIQIRINAVDFSSIPVYEALSYTWASEPLHGEHNVEEVREQPRVSVVNHHGMFRKYKSLKIQENLASALVQLRGQSEDRRLWIDALCINQNDDEEKARQITKMRMIYEKASRVVVWLGRGSEQSDRAFNALSIVARQVRWNDKTQELVPVTAPDVAWKNCTDAEFKVPFHGTTWEAIKGLLERTWFRRLWIWQEIHVARHDTAIVQCGESKMRWSAFRTAIRFLYNGCDKGEDGNEDDERFRNAFRTAVKPVYNIVSLPAESPLLSLLGLTRRGKCTVKEDRIYACYVAVVLFVSENEIDMTLRKLLELAQHTSEPAKKLIRSIKVKYGPEYYIRACRSLATAEIQIMQRLSILNHCDAMVSTDSLPSWVPNWNEPLPYQNLNLGMFGGGIESLPNMSLGKISDDTLKVDGVFCDSIESCSDRAAAGEVTELQIRTMIHDWCQILSRKLEHQSTTQLRSLSDNTLVALCHALTSGYIGDRYPEDYGPVNLQAAINIIRIIHADPQSTTSSQGAYKIETEKLFYHMSNVLPGRRIFCTEAGRVGLGPSQTQRGDKVASIIGSKHLLLLRGLSSQSHTFTIIGICYLHGFMNLEAILGPVPSNCSVQLARPCIYPWDMRFVCDGVSSLRDPRMGKSHDGWEASLQSKSGPVVWRHVASKHETKSDPRHTDVEFLQRRDGYLWSQGKSIEEILLV